MIIILVHALLYHRKTGKALTFITRENWRWARDLCNVLAQANQVLCMQNSIAGLVV